MTFHPIRRAIWGLLAVGHAAAMPALFGTVLGVSGSSEDLGTLGFRIASLSAAVLFCLLKAVDVRWLRIRPGWKPAVGSFVVAAMLHANVLTRETGIGEEYAPVPFGAALVATLLVEPDAYRRVAREFRSLLARRISSDLATLDQLVFSWISIELHSLRSPVCGMLCRAPRPPPSH